MTILQLIDALRSIEAEYGDLTVLSWGDGGFSYTPAVELTTRDGGYAVLIV
jgi:dTDP-4-amino-4,6-dideoxygalactose transaminase